MSFTDRMTRCPRPFEPDQGAETRARFPDVAPEPGELIEGAAGCSPYLRTLCEKETAWLPGALDAPEAALEGVLAEIRETAPDGVANGLRQAKRRVALLTGLADLAGVWALEEVTGHLTRFADAAVQVALRAAIGVEIRRGKLPGVGEDELDSAGGMTVLAMGKMGAGELNYSSDIDLICLFDGSLYGDADVLDARQALVRVTRSRHESRAHGRGTIAP